MNSAASTLRHQLLGQDPSIVASTFVPGVPLIQSTMPERNVPSPTTEGMRSLALKRIVACGLCMRDTEAFSNTSGVSEGMIVLAGLIAPPSAIRLFAHAVLAR